MTAMPSPTFATNHVDADTPAGPPMFERLGEGHYRLATGDWQIMFEAERVRHERGALVCQLAVYCSLAGVSTIDGKLSDAAFNLSTLRDRRERAQWLAMRAKTHGAIDWETLLEELCQRVLASEREGNPAIDLSTLPAVAPEAFLDVLGLKLPARHMSMVFGDGGCGKSYLANVIAGELIGRGIRVGLWDWELDEFSHHQRMRSLFGDVPSLVYIRCDRPLAYEVERHMRLVEKHRIEFGLFDSAGYGCAGPPEAAEGATGYCQAFRRLGIGGLHVAHVTKGEQNDQRPFGSVFWHNSARATWFAKRAGSEESDRFTIGLFNRKSNLRSLQGAVGLELSFGDTRTTYRNVAVADVRELAGALPLWQRIKSSVRTGPKTLAALAEELDAKVDSVEKAVKRKGQVFTFVSETKDNVSRVALAERRVGQ